MYYDTITEKWHASRQTLPNSRGNTMGLRTADDALLARHGIIRGQEQPPAADMVPTGRYTVEVVGTMAYRYPECITLEASQAQAQAALAKQVSVFLKEQQANVVKFFTAVQHFPAIELPTTYDAALDVMNAAIEASAVEAKLTGDWGKTTTLQNQSRIAQDIYTRILEPCGWTGIKLAQLAAALQGGH